MHLHTRQDVFNIQLLYSHVTFSQSQHCWLGTCGLSVPFSKSGLPIWGTDVTPVNVHSVLKMYSLYHCATTADNMPSLWLFISRVQKLCVRQWIKTTITMLSEQFNTWWGVRSSKMNLRARWPTHNYTCYPYASCPSTQISAAPPCSPACKIAITDGCSFSIW